LDSNLITLVLPCALAVIMFGLGLSLTADDFRRVRRHPRAVGLALLCQIAILPAVALGLVHAFGLRPDLAVGFMLLAAAPGGPMANLFSHLFKGDLALNITLTAINSLASLVTLPLITNFAIHHFMDGGASLGVQVSKLGQAFAVVLVPVAIGMLARRRSPGFAARMDRPVRTASSAFLGLVIVLAIVQERAHIADYVAAVGLICLVFAAISIAVGFAVPRLAGVPRAQSIACGYEIGLHNSAMAMLIAVTVLGSTAMAVPASIYVLAVWPPALVFGLLMRAAQRREEATALPVRPALRDVTAAP
jgi:bile acid:Na+ symporter, BASS family